MVQELSGWRKMIRDDEFVVDERAEWSGVGLRRENFQEGVGRYF